MGQDHGGLDPSNQGSKGKESAQRVGIETTGKQRTVNEGQRECVVRRHEHTQIETWRTVAIK